jgi:hypothetical protein
MAGASSDPSWEVIAYEVRMFRASYEIVLDPAALAQLQKKVFINAIEESAVLHTRILCEVFLDRGSEPDDIALSRLFSDWYTDYRYRGIKRMLRELRNLYGTGSRRGSPCWVFNKMMAHPTTHRGISYDYIPILRDLDPVILKIIAEIEALRGVRFTWSW